MTAPTRTLQFFGQAYGDTPVTLIVTINNSEVFNGTVNTIPETPPRGLETTEQVLLFSVPFASGVEGRGLFPMTVSVDGGTGVILGSVKSNYAPTGVGTNSGPDLYTGVSSGDVRSDVEIDGIAQIEPVRESGKSGSYCWLVYSGSTLSHKLNLA